MVIDTVTITGILKGNKVINGKMYNIVDSIMQKDQNLVINGKSLFEPFQKAGGIYLIVHELKV